MLSSLSKCVVRFLWPGLALCAISSVSAQDRLLPVFHFELLDNPFSGGILSRVVRDQYGFIWIGTYGGLQRYDGYGSKIFRNTLNDPRSLASNDIRSLLLDSKKRLWIGTAETGLSLYDSRADRFVNFHADGVNRAWDGGSRRVNAIFEDRKGELWLGTSSGLLRVQLPSDANPQGADSLSHGVSFESYSLDTPQGMVLDLCDLPDGTMAVASDSGLFVFDPLNRTLARPHLPDPLGARLDVLFVNCLRQEPGGTLWLGTGTEGVFRIDWTRKKVTNYRHVKDDSLSIGSDEIRDIVVDQLKRVWIATTSGVDLLVPESGHRSPYLVPDENPPGSSFMRMSVDSTGVLWIGTGLGGLYCLTSKSQRFPHYSVRSPRGTPRSFHTIEPDRYNQIWASTGNGFLYHIDAGSRKILKAVNLFGGQQPGLVYPDRTTSLRDSRGKIWCGTWGLGLYGVDPATGMVQNYRFESRVGSSSIVRSLAQGPGDSLWLSCNWHGLMKFCTTSGNFQKILSNLIATVMRDRDGRLWLTTEGNGLMIYEPLTGSTSRFFHDPADSLSLANNRTRLTYEDPEGRIWVSAGNIIHLWDPAARSFRRYPTTAFTEAQDAMPLGTDAHGRLWVSYLTGPVGLSILDPRSGAFTSFDHSDGLSRKIFDMELLQDGRVLLSGSEGLNIVHPDSLNPHRPAPPLLITRMSINDQPALPPILVGGSGIIRLSHRQDVLEFEFAAVDVEAPQLVRYDFQLEGLEEAWVHLEGRRFVRYSGLRPGNYTFKVRASSSRGEWPDQQIAIAVAIAPPWWQTAGAYGAYAFLLFGLLYAGYRVRLRQVQLQQEVELGRFKAEHLAEVDRLKSRFFANISHEFRTPLTLILGPIRKLQNKAQHEDDKKDLGMAERNAHRLLRLINQLLDLSKLEAGAMKLRASRMNIIPFVKGIAYSFESSAGMRGVALNVLVDQEEIEVYCDKDMMEKILTNLLSNAFKFTPAGGKVTVHISHPRPNDQTRATSRSVARPSRPYNAHTGTVGRGRATSHIPHHVSITVTDTGIGIPPEQLDKVFDRFYQVDASQTREHEGSGIGLSLVKELVELHHGAIQVQSEVGRGTTFTVQLPLGRAHLKDEEIVVAEEAVPHEIAPSSVGAIHVEDPAGSGESPLRDEPPEKDTGKSLPIILIIEDNADVRAYIKNYLVSAFQVTEARDGAEGIEKAMEIIPDLIISDVMMPRKDGYEVCRTLKLDEKTSHIPIVLLTAKAASENRIEGLEIGADDYLIKPFEPKELLARVKNLIDLRRKLRERFSAGVPLKPGEIAITSADDTFLQRVQAIVERRMADENFSVEEFADELCMSRSQLHRKLTALTNLSASDFIRYLRLHRAMDLLKSGAGSVSEVAYRVGFGDPSHFSKSFHRQFGIAPSGIRND